jgi:hypothetical protein
MILVKTMWPKHESRKRYLMHREHHTHERGKPLYRGHLTPEHQRAIFEQRYGHEKGDYVYGAVVGKVYREKYGHPYEGGKHPVGRKGHELPRR